VSEKETVGKDVPIDQITKYNGIVPKRLNITKNTTLKTIIEHFRTEIAADWTPESFQTELSELKQLLHESELLLDGISENELFITVGFSRLDTVSLPKKIGHVQICQCILCRDAASQVGPANSEW